MISACFTNHNRTELLFEAVKPFLEHEIISEVVISDDCSNDDVYRQLLTFAALHPKVRLFRNERNIDCYLNKREAVKRAINDWVFILDSDNIFTRQYIDRVESLWIAGVNDKTVYQPSFAKPHFDFTKYEGTNVTKGNVSGYMGDATFQTMLNAFNYFVNRSEYLRVFDATINPVTSDSIFHNYNWLRSGNSIYVVPDLHYEHRVHAGSHYQQNVRKTPAGFHESVVKRLKDLR